MMITKKKIIALLFICLLIMGLPACNNKQSGEGSIIETAQIKTEKEVIVLGALSINEENYIGYEVARFNKNSETHQIEIIQYGNDNWDEEGVMKLHAEIIAGKGPDIFVMPKNMSLDIYAQKKILANLYQFIDDDEKFKREDFFENILKAYEIDDQLFGLPIFFMLETVFGPQSEFDDILDWTLDEMMLYANEKMPESMVYDNANKSAVLDFCLTGNEGLLVDWENNSGSFKREMVLKMLHFANQFTDGELSDHYFVPDYERIKAGDIQLVSYTLFTFNDNQLPQEIFREPITYIGYPTESGNGNLIDSSSLIAINQSSQYKAEAWEFIKMLLTDQFQTRAYLPGFPIVKSAFDLKAIEEMADKIKPFTYNWGDFSIELVPTTENEVQIIRNLIGNADTIRKYDQQLHNIVMEEAELFFRRVKTAEEVVDVMENRIRIYVNETFK